MLNFLMFLELFFTIKICVIYYSYSVSLCRVNCVIFFLFFLQNLRQTLDDLTRNGFSVVSAISKLSVEISLSFLLDKFLYIFNTWEVEWKFIWYVNELVRVGFFSLRFKMMSFVSEVMV